MLDLQGSGKQRLTQLVLSFAVHCMCSAADSIQLVCIIAQHSTLEWWGLSLYSMVVRQELTSLSTSPVTSFCCASLLVASTHRVTCTAVGICAKHTTVGTAVVHSQLSSFAGLGISHCVAQPLTL